MVNHDVSGNVLPMATAESLKLTVNGHRLFNSRSEVVRLHGVNLQDPLWQRMAPGDRMLPHGTLAMETAKAWGANCVRIPFHPVTIRHAGRGSFENGLNEVAIDLNWILMAARALDLRVIVDFHSIGFPATQEWFEFDEEPFQNLYSTSRQEIDLFWSFIAKNFGDHPCLAALEIFNEAARGSQSASLEDWKLHSEWAEGLIRTQIRPFTETLAIVGGLHFGYDLEFVPSRPVHDLNVAYSSHPYPHHSQLKSWNRAFGAVAKHYPVLLTELGFSEDGFFDRNHHRGYRDWELEIRTYADQLGLSFCAWNFSHSWEPTLLKTKDMDPKTSGLFFRDWMSDLS